MMEGVMRSIFVAVLLVILCGFAVAGDVYKIDIDDTIQPVSEDYIARAIATAESKHADALIIELKTPGGLYESTRSIVDKILFSKVPVIVYVRPGGWAASAGFFILQSGDIAAMAPGTNTGAAHPVIPGYKMDDLMKEKVENDSAAFIRSYVSKRGRNVEAAENAVRKSLSFTDEEALKQNIIDVIAKDDADLLKQVDGRSVARFDGSKVTLHTANDHIVTLDMSLKQRILSALLDPNLAYILFAVGMMALYAEFNHPGAVVPGVIGGICILLALFAMHWLPIRFSAAALILLAFIFFALEAKYQSHGALGIGGIFCMIIGAMLLVDGPIPEMRINWRTAIGVALPFGAITIFLTTIAMRARAAKVVTGEQGMIGMIGIAQSPLTPQGKVFVNGELWNAIALAPVKSGQPVRVRSIHGLTVEVEPEATHAPAPIEG
jgi:membrane-bound serine protease (ClpP class)